MQIPSCPPHNATALADDAVSYLCSCFLDLGMTKHHLCALSDIRTWHMLSSVILSGLHVTFVLFWTCGFVSPFRLLLFHDTNGHGVSGLQDTKINLHQANWQFACVTSWGQLIYDSGA